MKNANKPAFPIKIMKDHLDDEGKKVGSYPKIYAGLTKREEIAAKNYAQLIGNTPNPEAELDVFAKIAVQGADALLTELNQ